jgi:hypothetical protein
MTLVPGKTVSVLLLGFRNTLSYPATVNELIKKRLHQFLALTEDLNFNAKLAKS